MQYLVIYDQVVSYCCSFLLFDTTEQFATSLTNQPFFSLLGEVHVLVHYNYLILIICEQIVSSNVLNEPRFVAIGTHMSMFLCFTAHLQIVDRSKVSECTVIYLFSYLLSVFFLGTLSKQ